LLESLRFALESTFPIPDHAFLGRRFSGGEVGNHLLERCRLGAVFLYLRRRGLSRSKPCQPLLARLEELVQPAAVQAFGYSLAPTERGNARISAQAGKDNADLLLGRIVPAALPLDPLTRLFPESFDVLGFCFIFAP
jgi:hypothetical protein